MTDQPIPKTARPRWIKFAGFTALALLLAGLLAALLVTPARYTPSPLVGQPAAGFTLERLGGGTGGTGSSSTGSLADYRGKVVVLNFWGSWCAPCRTEAPDLRAFDDRNRSKGVALVGVTVKDKPKDSVKFLEEFGLTNPNFDDPIGRVNVEYGLTGVPETYIIDRSGVIRQKFFGPQTLETLERAVKEYL
jgi:cytochrome c biogenesis protein CcmG/thiol:disulfide interchange protein DsbE